MESPAVVITARSKEKAIHRIGSRKTVIQEAKYRLLSYFRWFRVIFEETFKENGS